MKCTTCEHKIHATWKFCPECGSTASGDDMYSHDRLKYLLGQMKDGKFIYSNFEAMRNTGRWSGVDVIRPLSGDLCHLALHNLRMFSFLDSSPKSVQIMYDIGKYIGQCSVGEAMKVLGTEKLVNVINRSGLFWKIFELKRIQNDFHEGWVSHKVGLLGIQSIDRQSYSVYFTLSESINSIIDSNKNLEILATGALAGQAEGLFNGEWDGIEVKRDLSKIPQCELKIYLHKGEKDVELPVFNKEELSELLDQLTAICVDKRSKLREHLGDYSYMGIDQCVNYFLLSSSTGHNILSKYSGALVGERIAEKAVLDGEDSAFCYARDLFLYLKAGILHKPEDKGDRFFIRMDESIYSSGVNNIGMKLDVFLAGIIEGLLKKATGEKWLVEEKKCLANGDPYCKFVCKKIS